LRKYENGSWINVGSGISAETSPVLNVSIGSDNLPLILYREGNLIKFKKFDGSNWVLLSQTSEFIPYTALSLELDNNNVPYVVSNYQVGTTYNCFVRKLNGTAWEEVGITGFSNYGSSLAFDTSNTPHIFLKTAIKKFNGSTWENLDVPLTVSPAFGGMSGTKIYFSNGSLYAGYSAGDHNGFQNFYIKKLTNGIWQQILTNGFMYDLTYTVGGDYVYRLSYGPGNYPSILKMSVGQSVALGNPTLMSAGISSTSFNQFDNETFTHDFAICNGIPMVATASSVSVSMFVNDNWTNLGALQISETGAKKALIKSGTDGNIYLAYNNSLSSTPSDTKMTVKRYTASGWEAVGPVNFSQSAGAQFDFKLGHDNKPYVLYMAGRLQKYDGSDWVYIGGSAYSGDVAARLALDSNDLPYIAYRDAGHIAVKKRNGNVWEYVDQAGLSAYTGQQYHPRIVIDAANNIYLGFTDSTLRVYIKKLNNGVWESVGPEFITSAKTDQYELAVDHDNVLYISYNELIDDFRSKAKVKKFNGSSWEFVGEPDFSPTSVHQVKLDFWENNTPIVAYSNYTNSAAQIGTRFFGEANALATITPANVAAQSASIVPNPASDRFSIKTAKNIETVEIFDLLGKKVLSETEKSQDIDVSALHSGIYIVKVKTDGGTNSVKLIKQ